MNIELGTKEFPFKALDDAFREIFNYAGPFDPDVIINIRADTINYMYAFEMPLYLVNTNLKLR